MPRRFLVERAGEHFDLVESPAPSEHQLQLIDYRSDLLRPSVDDFDRRAEQRSLRGGHAPEHLATLTHHLLR